MTTCIFKSSNTKDHQFDRKTAQYQLNDLSTSIDVIRQYYILTISEGGNSTSNETSGERPVRILLIAFICTWPEFF